jgi:DNA/RNA-binding domain of Phe-tRNA-synthetase-like protein
MTDRLSLDPEARDLAAVGLLRMTGVDPGAPAEPIHEEIARLGAALRASYGEPSRATALLRPARELYKSLGLDPTKNRPSSEALFRRVLKGDGLYRVNAVVDAANLCSLRMMLPVGLYDESKIEGAALLRVGAAGESYQGIGKGEIRVEGRWTLVDGAGPFGNPSADSWRTRVTESTRRIFMVVFAPKGYGESDLEIRLAECAQSMAAYCGGTLAAKGVVR